MRFRGCAIALAAALLMAEPGAALSQTVCPENVIRIIVPFPPGGPTDVAARLLAEKLKDRLGQNVIVESRAGAGGATGTGYVAQQPGNGCTMLLAYDTHAVNPVLLQLPFDTIAAFKPVVMVGTIPNIIAAHPAQPYNTFAAMVADAKKEPDRLAYATGGTGTVAHLSMKQIEQQYGMQLRNVPYRGGAPAAADVVAGHVPMMVGSVQALGIRAGRQGARAGAARLEAPSDAARHPEHGRARHERFQQRFVDGHFRAVEYAGCDCHALPRRLEKRARRFLGARADGVDGRRAQRRLVSGPRTVCESRDDALGRRGEALQHQGGVVR
jgi:tripartite-type tricarboxylate transporter receptor subunit TctC